MAEAKGDERGDEPADAVAGEPDARAGGDLVAGVPGGGQEHEGGRDGGLCDAEEEADGEEAAVVCAGGCEGDDGAPEEGVCGHVLCDGEAGDEEGGWVGPGEVAKVEDAGDPAVVLAFEMLFTRLAPYSREMYETECEKTTYGVGSETKYRGAGQNRLIHEVEHVSDEEQRDNIEINLADNLPGHVAVNVLPVPILHLGGRVLRRVC